MRPLDPHARRRETWRAGRAGTVRTLPPLAGERAAGGPPPPGAGGGGALAPRGPSRALAPPRPGLGGRMRDGTSRDSRRAQRRPPLRETSPPPPRAGNPTPSFPPPAPPPSLGGPTLTISSPPIARDAPSDRRASPRGEMKQAPAPEGAGAWDDPQGVVDSVRQVANYFAAGAQGLQTCGIGTAQDVFFCHSQRPSWLQTCLVTVSYTAGIGISLL